jgi:hypothetical protein
VAAIGWIVTYVVLIVVGVVARGWTLTILWGWFIVPTFHLPALNIAPALGLSMVVGYLTRQDVDVESPKRTQGERLARAVAQVIGSVFLTLAMGWIVHMFMGGA